MSAASIPPIVLASVACTLGGYHLLSYISRPRDRQYLTFAVVCFAIALYDLGCAGLYSATSPVEGLAWQRFQFVGINLAAAALLCFVADYTAQRSKNVAHTISAGFVLIALIASVERAGLTWSNTPLVKEVKLLWGIEITYFEMAPGPLADAFGWLGVAVLVYLLWVGLDYWRRGPRHRAVALLAALLVFLAGALNDLLVADGQYSSVYLMEYSFLAVVVLMAYSLSGDLAVDNGLAGHRGAGGAEAAQTQEQIETQNQLRSILSSILQISIKNESLNEQLPQVVRAIASAPFLKDCWGVGIFLVEDEPEVLVLKAQHGLPSSVLKSCARVPFGECQCGETAGSGQLLFTDTIEGNGSSRHEHAEPHGHYTVPITSNGNTLGVIMLQVEEGHTRREHEEEFLKGIADTLAGLVERKLTQEAFDITEERLRSAFHHASAGMALTDLGGKYFLVNPALYEMLGYTEEELLDKGMLEVTHPADREKSRMLRDLLIAGDIRSDSYRMEKRHLHKNGRTIWSLVSVSLIRDAQGNPDHTIGHVEDITDRKHAEEALRESEEKFRQLAENIQEAFWMITLGTEGLAYVSPAYEAIWGRSRDGLYESAEAWMEPIHPEDRPRVVAALAAIGESGKFEEEYRIVRPDGTLRWIQDRAFPVRNEEGDIFRYVGVAADITERKDAEEEAQLRQEQLVEAGKMISLGILVSGVTKEISKPNHFILSTVETLKDIWQDAAALLEAHYEEHGDFELGGMNYTEARERVLEMLSGIRAGSEHVKTIVEELGNYGQDHDEGLKEAVRINEVVRSAAALLSGMLEESTSRFTTDLAEDIPALEGDRQRLEQLIVNLLQNACQALSGDDEGLHVSTRYDAGSEVVIVEVEDEGVGFPEAIRDHITDPFFTTKRESGGIGLGLSIAAGIAMEHGGALNFASVPGKGTRATVILPLNHNGYSIEETTE